MMCMKNIELQYFDLIRLYIEISLWTLYHHALLYNTVIDMNLI